MSDSVIVQVQQHGSEQTQSASKLVWWLASLASCPPREHLTPIVGDIVVETTHRLGMARHRLGLIDAVGELIAVENIDGSDWNKIYTIRTLEGKEQRWENASVSVVERPRKQNLTSVLTSAKPERAENVVPEAGIEPATKGL